MAWDDDKSTAADPENPTANEQLSADEWDAHVADQKGHASRHEAGGADEVTNLSELSGVTGEIVQPGEDLQAAIDAASVGDYITIASGTHPVTSTVTVDKELNIFWWGQLEKQADVTAIDFQKDCTVWASGGWPPQHNVTSTVTDTTPGLRAIERLYVASGQISVDSINDTGVLLETPSDPESLNHMIGGFSVTGCTTGIKIDGTGGNDANAWIIDIDTIQNCNDAIVLERVRTGKLNVGSVEANSGNVIEFIDTDDCEVVMNFVENNTGDVVVDSFSSNNIIKMGDWDTVTSNIDNDSTVLTHVSRPASAGAVAAYRSSGATDQQVATTDTDTIIFDTEDLDADSAYDASTGVWTCEWNGQYQIESTVAVNNHASGDDIQLRIYKNNNEWKRVYFDAADTTVMSQSVSANIPFQEGDTASIRLGNFGAGSVDVVSSDSRVSSVDITQIEGASRLSDRV